MNAGLLSAAAGLMLGATSAQPATMVLSQHDVQTTDAPAIYDQAEIGQPTPPATFDMVDEVQLAIVARGEGRGAAQVTALAHSPIGAMLDLLPWVLILLTFAGLGFSGYRKAKKGETAFDLS
jgi:hypothetical protein